MAEEDDNNHGVIVHLGFIEPVNDNNDKKKKATAGEEHPDTDYHDEWIVGHVSPQYDLWDGGQIGGRPSFLDPQNLPTKPITCQICGDVMKFLLQIYAPIDVYEDRAFHRTLYVFCCPNNHQNHNSNSDNKNHDDTVGTIRVLRVQLPQENPYFPYESSSAAENWDAHLPSSYNIQLCQVCGMRGPFKCPLQNCYFCSKQHQKEYKKFVFNVTSTQKASVGQEKNGVDNDSSAYLRETGISSSVRPVLNLLPSVYPFAALVVGEEEQEQEGDDDTGADNGKNATKNRKSLFDYDSDDDEEESDRNLEQGDLNRMTGRKSTVEIQHDVTANFQRKCQSNPWQVLRYARTWATTTNDQDDSSNEQQDDGVQHNHPLWIRADYQPQEIPPCPYCKSPRKFEFQLMPQLLHGLERLQKQQRLEQQESLVQSIGADCQSDLEKKGQSDDSTSLETDEAANNNKYRQVMEAVQQADDLIQQAPPEQIPPSLVEAKEAALERLRQERFGLVGQRRLEKKKTTVVDAADWGVVAIYTCTKSCNGGEPADGVTVLDPVLGTYREEFAWRQPSLDAP